jgi:hypothetical protein
MRTSRSLLILFALLILGLGLTFPAEDVLDTTYDEYEALPYEATPLFSIMVPRAAAWRIKPSQSAGHLQVITVPLGLARTTSSEARQVAEPRAALALLCTLLC